MTKITARQARFVAEYMIDLNATQAAIRAGYAKGKAAEVQGARLLGNAKVAAEIAARQQKRADKLEITADRVLAELAKLGFSNMGDYVQVVASGDIVNDFSTMTPDKWAPVQEITVDEYTEGRGEEARDVKRVKFKLADKRAALVDVGKHIGMWPNKVEIAPTEDLAKALELAWQRGKPG